MKRRPRRHIPTAGAPTYGRIAYDLTGEKVTYFTARTLIDVGGEFREQWIAVVQEYNPDGIIFVVDTSDPELEQIAFEYLFEIYKKWTEKQLVRRIRLKAVIVMIDKADLWATNVAQEAIQISEYQRLFAPIVKNFESLLQINVLYGCTSMTHASFFNQNDQLLREMAAELARAFTR
jgi:hypothetical protein